MKQQYTFMDEVLNKGWTIKYIIINNELLKECRRLNIEPFCKYDLLEDDNKTLLHPIFEFRFDNNIILKFLHDTASVEKTINILKKFKTKSELIKFLKLKGD